MTTLLIIGAVLVWCGLLCAAAEYLVRRIERAAEAYEAPLGPAAGCLVGLAIAAVMWAEIIGAAWGIWIIVR